MKLTKRTIDALKPAADGWYYVWDEQLAGFGVGVGPTGRKVFVLKYRTAGAKQRKGVLGEIGVLTPDEARSLAMDRLSTVRKGGDPAAERELIKRAVTLGDAVPRYLMHVETKKKPRTLDEYRRLLAQPTVAKLLSRRLDDIEAADAMRLHERMRDTPVQANRTLAVLSALFGWAAKAGLRNPNVANPCTVVDWYHEQPGERYLSANELRQLGDVLERAEREGLLPAPSRSRGRKTGATAKHRSASVDVPIPADPHAVAAIRLLLFTGARKNEVLRLTWDEVDLAGARLRLGDSKTGAKVIPLGAPAVDLLAERPRSGPYVFPGRDPARPLATIRRVWEAARHAAGLQDVRLHDIRHSFASMAASGGASLLVIGALLGHRRPSTTKRYAHLVDDTLRSAADTIAGNMAAALAPAGKTAVRQLKRRRAR